MKRKLINGAMVFLLLFVQFSTLLGGRQVHAEPVKQETIIDNQELKVAVSGTVTGEQITWKVAYDRHQSELKRALKLRVSTDEAGEKRLAPEKNELGQQMQAKDDVATNQWWIEKAYSPQAIGELTFKTSIDQPTLHVAVQMNEEKEVATTADPASVQPATPEVTTDLLDQTMSGPHAVTVPVPEAASVADEAVATEPEVAEAEATKPEANETQASEADTAKMQTPAEEAAPAVDPQTPKQKVEALKTIELASGEQASWSNAKVANDAIFFYHDRDAKQMLVRVSFAIANRVRTLTIPEGWQVKEVSDPAKATRDGDQLKLALAGVRKSAQLDVTLSKAITSEEQAAQQGQFDLTIDDTIKYDVQLKLATTTNAAKIVTPPSQANPLAATNLILTLGARASMDVGVDGLADREFSTYSKKHGAGLSKYGSEDAMKNMISTDYQTGSEAEAIIMNSHEIAKKATITLDYSHVGYVQTNSGDVQIGAYVTVKNIVPRFAEWSGDAANRVGIDFSNNFYSGVSLANIREFDWEVTFYYKDGDTKRAVNFVEVASVEKPMLTFTSLNPGEFVQPTSGGNSNVIVSDNSGVAQKYLSSNSLVPSDENRFANYSWPTTGEIQAYTSEKWGNWNQGETIDPNYEWADWLGAPTFGDGAASFALTGTTFNYRRGTYSDAQETWLANASGTARFEIPALKNNKSITQSANEGGGNADQKKGDIYTDNGLHTTNIDKIAEAGDTMFYYINQETYTVIEEVISRPNTIIIEDTLPAGMRLENNSVNDIKVLNETQSERTVPQLLTSFPNGQSQNGSKIEVSEVAGRVKIKVTLVSKDVMNIPFQSGYFSVQVKVRSNYKPSNIDEEKTMANSATVKMLDAKGEEKYAKETNEVFVTVKPDNPEFDVSFNKVDSDNQPLSGVQFGLFANQDDAEAIYRSNVTTANGEVKFTKVVPGDYWLKEMQTPAGYQPIAPIKVTIDNDGKLSGLTNNRIVNEYKEYALELLKQSTSGQRLNGAEFVVEADGKTVATGTSKTDETLVFDHKLKPGTYTLREISAPTGFKKLDGTFSFTLKPNGTIDQVAYSGDDLTEKQWGITMSDDKARVVFDITNEPDTTELPVTGGSGIGAYLALALLLMGVAGGIWLVRKKGVRGDA
ncbi:SpaA isopeptide-forming pilin-related protein [Lacticaseibacillus sp. GG6-2]